MHKMSIALGALTAALLAPAVAQAELSFNVGAVTDYRYRGVSQSRLKPALQGGVDYAHASGAYVGLWASTIKWIKDAGGSADVEVDLYGGYKGEISPGLGYDVGILSYQYPGHKLGVSPVTNEIYGALTFGPATLKYSHSVSNLFGFADSKNSGYLDLSASFDVGGGVTITPHIGHQKVSGGGTNGDYSYTDYSVSASAEMIKGLTVSGGLYGTDNKLYVSPDNKNLGRAGLVLGVKYAF